MALKNENYLKMAMSDHLKLTSWEDIDVIDVYRESTTDRVTVLGRLVLRHSPLPPIEFKMQGPGKWFDKAMGIPGVNREIQLEEPRTYCGAV